MKFTKKKMESPDGVIVIYTQIVDSAEKPFPPLQITSSRLGVKFSGESQTITDMKELQDFAEIVSKAWVSHVELVPKIVTPAEAGVQP